MIVNFIYIAARMLVRELCVFLMFIPALRFWYKDSIWKLYYRRVGSFGLRNFLPHHKMFNAFSTFFLVKKPPFLLALLMLCNGCGVFAEGLNAVRYFDLPGQSLQSGLIEFAMQANITIIADQALLANYQSLAVAGPMKVDEAFVQLLSASPLQYVYQAQSDAYILQLTSSPSRAAATLPAKPIDEILVIGNPVYPFRYHTLTHTQNQGGKSYYDASRFLNVVPQQLIKDQQAKNLHDILKFSSGITPGDGASDSNDDVYIRGFQRHAIYVDGFRLSNNTGINLLPVNVERIEIVKGPSTMLFGQAQPGGIVNVIRKKPQDDNFIHLDVGVGDFHRRDFSADVNQQLRRGEDINVRLVVADQSQAKSSEIRDISKQLIAPSLVWKFTADTTLDLGYEYQQAAQTIMRDVPVFLPSESFPGIKLTDILNQVPGFRSEFELFNAELNHYFNADWRLRTSFVWQQEAKRGVRVTEGVLQNTDLLFKSGELISNYLLLSPANVMTIPVLAYPTREGHTFYQIGKIRSLYDQQEFDTANNVSIHLDGNFSAFSLLQRITSGVDWHRQDFYKEYLVEAQDPFVGQWWNSPEFFQSFPDIAAALSNPQRPLGDFNSSQYWLIYDDYGIFVQDSIELNDRWMLSAGTRYTVTTGDYSMVDEAKTIELATYKKFSSQAGVTYKASDSKTFFANYSEALRANYHVDDVGAQPEVPELSDQIEIGLKTQAWNGRFLSSFSFFDIDKNNIIDLAIVDDIRQSLAAHSVNAKGMDYDFTWQASANVNVIGALSLLSPRITSGINNHNVPALAASQSASLFLHSDLPHNFDVSAGVNYVGKRYADNENKFPIGSYSTLDLNFSYGFINWRGAPKLQLSIKNATNKTYDTAVLDGIGQNPGEGRMLIAKLGLEF